MAQRLKDALRDATSEIAALGAMLDEGKISKKELREMHGRLSRAIGYVPGNVKFAYDMFAEAVEHTVEDAKTEFEAHVAATADRLGMEQLRHAGNRLMGGGEDSARVIENTPDPSK